MVQLVVCKTCLKQGPQGQNRGPWWPEAMEAKKNKHPAQAVWWTFGWMGTTRNPHHGIPNTRPGHQEVSK